VLFFSPVFPYNGIIRREQKTLGRTQKMNANAELRNNQNTMDDNSFSLLMEISSDELIKTVAAAFSQAINIEITSNNFVTFIMADGSEIRYDEFAQDLIYRPSETQKQKGAHYVYMYTLTMA